MWFDSLGVTYYNCGFKNDLLSLHGITGKVDSIDTVSGSFHIEDTLSVCAETLNMEDFAKFYLFDADLIIEDTASLIMGDTTFIIARSGDCRIIVRGTLTIGNGVIFEARDGATLEIIFENNADLAISNATFINCTLDLPKQNLSFDRCNFMGTPLLMDNTLDQNPLDGKTATISNCKLLPNGKEIDNALFIKNFAHYNVSGCTIGTEDNGIFKNGIAIYNSGSNSGWKHVNGNDVSGCLAAGIQMYSSAGNITMNTITRNGFGIKLLNNCNIGFFSGDCGATTENDTQFIHDNDDNEIYMTGSSIPQWFRYNAIADVDNTPFVYHDAYANVGFPNDTTLRKAIDVTYNHWGNNFIPSTHLYTTLIGGYYDYNPSWVLGSCDNEKDGGMVLLSEADSLNNIGQYSVAKSLYRQVVTSYPATVSAETALKSLFLLEEASGENYEVLQDYYLSDESIATNFTLSHLASSMANKCDEKMENYEEAIAWYENVLTDPETSFNDSIFAAIDLGDLYLKMEAIGMKNVCGKLMQYKPDSSIKHICRVQSALSLLPKKQMELNKNEENQPISDLEIEVLNNDKVILTWNMPEINGDMALSWITSETNDGGCTQAGFDNIFGHLYDKFDLRNHIGWRIDSISFYKTTQWTYRICVWRKYDGESMELIHSQLAHVEDSVLEEWCSVAIDTSLFIEENANYWFGVRATQEEGQTGPIFPIPFDGGPAIVGKGDLFMPDLAHWNSMGIGYNAMLKVTLNNDSMIVTNELESTIPNGYHVYRDGTLIKEIPYSFVTYFTDTEFTRETDVEYCVTAVYGNEESEAVCATAIITDVEEKLVNEGISVSPNPTNSLVRIKGTIVSDVQVYNAMGQLVKIVQNTNEVDLSGLTPGVYSLLIKDIHGIHINKKVVVKQL